MWGHELFCGHTLSFFLPNVTGRAMKYSCCLDIKKWTIKLNSDCTSSANTFFQVHFTWDITLISQYILTFLDKGLKMILKVCILSLSQQQVQSMSHMKRDLLSCRTHPVWLHWSHDSTRVSRCRDGSGGPAGFPPCKNCRADAEALKGAQQTEAIVLGFGFRMNNLRQLVGERYVSASRPQVVCVLWVLSHGGRI